MGGAISPPDYHGANRGCHHGHLPSPEAGQRQAPDERIRRLGRFEHRPLPDRTWPGVKIVFAWLQMADVVGSERFQIHNNRDHTIALPSHEQLRVFILSIRLILSLPVATPARSGRMTPATVWRPVSRGKPISGRPTPNRSAFLSLPMVQCRDLTQARRLQLEINE
jgi:hypothetical protein